MMEKVIVVTGASSGIGAALAQLLGARGASIVLVARRAANLREIADRSGPRATPVVGDMTKRADVKRVVSDTISRFGRIDVWVNNVGQGITRKPTELRGEDIDEMMRVNVKSALYGMQEILPHFKERNAGHVINVSSMLGRVPYVVARSAYSGAKHYLNALTANFRMEVQETHPAIRFSLVSPGVVATEFGVNALHGGPDSRKIPDAQGAEEVAEAIARIIESPRPDVYTRAGSRERVLSYYASLAEDP
jgi:NADP-dependent 3-hydroxy acid dehydrogenase YdfG